MGAGAVKGRGEDSFLDRKRVPTAYGGTWNFLKVRQMFFQKKNSLLSQQIRAGLPKGMVLPESLEKLFNWMEKQGWTWETQGRAGGSLEPLESSGLDTAPYIEFFADDPNDLKYWFETENPEIRERLYVFARTGADGSIGAFWLDENGDQKIVHMGSGSGSTLVCVLASDPIDFLRLLAIGYEEICWGEFERKPDGDLPVNKKFRNWVQEEFNVEIPERGSTIVPKTSEMGDSESDDPFWLWARKVSNWDV